MANHPQILMFPSKREVRRQPGSNRLLTVVLAVYWLGMIFGTHYPRIPQLAESDGVDKWMHFGAYAGLAMLLATVLAVRRPAPGLIAVKIVALLAVAGAFDEITQPLVGRDCELLDWCADVVGALVGSCLIVGFAWFRRARTASSWDQAA